MRRPRSRSTTLVHRATAGLAALVLAASCAPGGSGSTPDQPPPVDCAPLERTETVTFASVPSLSLGTYFQAKAAGYFEEENVAIEETQLTTGQDSLSLLGRGQLDAAAGGIAAGLFSAIAGDVEVQAVASQGFNVGDVLPSGFYVRSDLLDSGEVDELADLRGRRIAITGTVGSASSYLVGLVLESGGVTLNDIEPVTLALPDTLSAFRSGSIDAGFVGAPYKATIDDEGVARPLGDQQLMTNQTQASLLIGPNLLRERPAVGCAFLRANMRAAQDLLTGDYNQDQAVVDAFVNEGDFPRETVLATPAYTYDPALEFNPDTIERMQDMFIAAGVLDVDQPLSFDEVVAEDLRAAAERSLAERGR